MAYWLVILALILLVVVHELGHFLAARAVGVRATKFYVFFPPAIFKRTIGGVEYGIGAIPAGGFVKLPGMFEPVPAEVGERLEWDVERLLDDCSAAGVDADREDGGRGAPLWHAAAALRDALDPDALAAQLGKLDDELVAFGTGPALAGAPGDRRRGLVKRIRTIRGRVANVIDDSHPKAYWRASLWRRMVVIFAGPLVNIVVAFAVLTLVGWLHVPTTRFDAPLRVDSVVKDGAAREAGIEKGSKIIGWDGPIVGMTVEEFVHRLDAPRADPVHLEWTDPDGARHDEQVTPIRIDGDVRLGVNLDDRSIHTHVEFHRTSPAVGARTALREMYEVTWGTATNLPQILFRKEVRDSVSSVVGIVQFAEEVDRANEFWHYVGIISIVLAVMNLLPLLPLDGGHLFFGFLEWARRGRPMPRASFERFSAVGFGLVLMLFFIGLNNDLG